MSVSKGDKTYHRLTQTGFAEPAAGGGKKPAAKKRGKAAQTASNEDATQSTAAGS